MTRRLLPLLALLCLSLAAPPPAAAADSKSAAKKKGKKAAPPPAKKDDPEPEDSFQEFINAPSTATPPAAEPEAAPETRVETRTETRRIDAASVDAPPAQDPEPPPRADLVAPPPPPAPGQNWWGPTVGHAGAYLTLAFGYNWWSLDRAKVTAQVFPMDDTAWMFDASLQNGAAAGLRGGYDILGHAHIGFNFVGTGWEVFSKERGGGGYIGGEVGWHPLSLVSALLPDGPLPGEKYYDFFLEGGAGFGIVGKHRALQGGVGSFGLGAEGYPAQWVSIGFRATWFFPFFNEYILNYDERTQPGNTLRLPDGSGGTYFAFTGHLAFHFGAPEN